MNTQMLDIITRKIKNKHATEVEQVQNIPAQLTSQEAAYVRGKLKTSAYYNELKQKQRAEREKLFFETFTIHNPYKSKDMKVANEKERELLKHVIYQHLPRTKVQELIQHYVLACKTLSSFELKLLTDKLLISCVDIRLRPYVRVRATELGTNKFAYYLVKENWKRETPNHQIWKFELKRLFGFFIEHEIEKFRVDLFKNVNGRKLIGEIVCTRQAIDEQFKHKIQRLMSIANSKIFLLAPTRIHQYLQDCVQENVFILNAKNVMPFLQGLLAEK